MTEVGSSVVGRRFIVHGWRFRVAVVSVPVGYDEKLNDA